MLAKVRAFLIVLEEGGLRRAAARLRVSQPALSRQIQALEHDLGGPLFERTSTGVRPTHGGHALASRLRPWIERFEAELVEVRRIVRGEGDPLRIGYLRSAARDYLRPAITRFHRSFPDVTLKLADTLPGEQIAGLRSGDLDLVLTDGSGAFLAREFYARKLESFPIHVAMAASHRFASRPRLRMSDLREEVFVRSSEKTIPGAHRQVERLCLKLGRFRPRTIGMAHDLDEALALVVNDGAVTLLPSLMIPQVGPCTVVRPIEDAGATWDLMVVWRRGRTGAALRALVAAFFADGKESAAVVEEARPAGLRGGTPSPGWSCPGSK
ncbi:MAG: LysR family transcriptional regulator [Verrucomicrobiae bacterium]|nr:LysR family transcriptional regulator [Verrucomicrobiae bacterium]